MTPAPSGSKLPVVRLEGGARERGLVHGEQFRERIATLLELWGDALEGDYGVQRARYLEMFFSETFYETTLSKFAPRILEEVRGISTGANADYRAVLAFQHVNEEFALAPRFAQVAPVNSGEACSTIVVAAREGRPALLAQNLDLAQYLDGFQILLRMPCDSGPGEIMALSVPGMISLMGMNSHGLAVCDNTLPQLSIDPAGVPVFALYRTLLERRSLTDAVALVTGTPHAVGLNWVMGDGMDEGVAMIERSARRAVRYGPNAPSAVAYHTNHPLVNDDWAEAYCNAAAQPRPHRSSYLRFAALHQRMAAAADIDAGALKDALRSRDDAAFPVSRSGGQGLEDQAIGFTLASSIFELRPGDPSWHMAAGPPHERPYHIYRFE